MRIQNYWRIKMTRDEAKRQAQYRILDKVKLIDKIYDDFESRLKTKRNYGLEKLEEWKIGNHAQYYQGYSDACGELLEGLKDD